MQSETLSFKSRGWFNATLFRKNMARFSPIWGIYTLILFFAMPMEQILSGGWGRSRAALLEDAEHLLRGNISGVAVPLGVVFGLLAGMALFSYLMNDRSVGMLHALPIRREGLFLTNWLSGLCFFLAPNLAIALATLCAQAVSGVALPGLVAWWLLVQTATCMFFFCLAVFCAMFTGHILALPIFYAIINALVAGVSVLADTAMGLLLMGYSPGTLFRETLVRWCTPAYQLMYLLSYHQEYSDTGELVWRFTQGSPAAAVAYCVVVGAVLTVLALEVYRRRQLERAGDLVSVGWVRPVFQYGLGACCGTALGIILYMNFFTRFGPVAFIALVAVCAALWGLAGRMMLKKTLRVLSDGWKGCAVLAVCMLVLLGGARMDLFGYQRWTPDPRQVASVQMRDIYSYPQDNGRYQNISLTDPALVAQMVEIHAQMVADLDRLGGDQGRGYYEGEDYQSYRTIPLRLEYLMDDGRSVRRSYGYVPITAEALADPDSYAAKLQALLNGPGMAQELYLMGGNVPMEDMEAVGAWLNNTNSEGEYLERELIAQDARLLWDALREDLAAGRIGRRYLLDDKERNDNCYYTDLNLSLSWTETLADGTRTTASTDLNITLQKSATSTLAALEELGLKDRLVERGSGGEEAYGYAEQAALG